MVFHRPLDSPSRQPNEKKGAPGPLGCAFVAVLQSYRPGASVLPAATRVLECAQHSVEVE
jgi:hypothetical protein